MHLLWFQVFFEISIPICTSSCLLTKRHERVTVWTVLPNFLPTGKKNLPIDVGLFTGHVTCDFIFRFNWFQIYFLEFLSLFMSYSIQSLPAGSCHCSNSLLCSKLSFLLSLKDNNNMKNSAKLTAPTLGKISTKILRSGAIWRLFRWKPPTFEKSFWIWKHPYG